MTFAILACLVAAQVPIEQPPRLRKVLDNGAAIIVERIPDAKGLSVQLFASSRGTEETPVTNGLRHLLEHLVAKGLNGNLDQPLETVGGFLQCETERDVMQFKMTLPPGQLDLGLRTVEQLMKMPAVTQDSIGHEAKIIAQEEALRDDASKLSVAAWSKAFGMKGLDVEGNLDVIRNATPAMLDKIHRVQFSGPNLAITVAGDVDLDATMNACAALLSKAPPGVVSKYDRGPSMGGEITVDSPGELIAVPTSGWRNPRTAARVAAAFALASEADQCFVICTPSAGEGMVLVGEETSGSNLAEVARKADADALFGIGRAMAKEWIDTLLRTPSKIAEIRGELLVQDFDLKPETMVENLDTMTPADFARAVEAFRSPEAVLVKGR